MLAYVTDNVLDTLHTPWKSLYIVLDFML